MSGLTAPKIRNYHKMIQAEIMEIIDDIGKMWPLVPEFIHYNSAEIATSVMLVTINYSAKLLWSKYENDKNKLVELRDYYIRLFKAIYTKYGIDRQRVNKFALTLNDVLIRVNE